MLLFIIILILFLITWGLLVQYFANNEVLKIKNIKVKRERLLSYIPIYGHYHVKKLPFNDREYSEKNYRNIYSRDQIFKRVSLLFGLTLIIFLILIPVAVLLYLRTKSAKLQTLLTSFTIILFILINQGLTVDYAKKKRYEGLDVAIIGLLPIVSFFIAKRIVRDANIKRILNENIEKANEKEKERNKKALMKYRLDLREVNANHDKEVEFIKEEYLKSKEYNNEIKVINDKYLVLQAELKEEFGQDLDDKTLKQYELASNKLVKAEEKEISLIFNNYSKTEEYVNEIKLINNKYDEKRFNLKTKYDGTIKTSHEVRNNRVNIYRQEFKESQQQLIKKIKADKAQLRADKNEARDRHFVYKVQLSNFKNNYSTNIKNTNNNFKKAINNLEDDEDFDSKAKVIVSEYRKEVNNYTTKYNSDVKFVKQKIYNNKVAIALKDKEKIQLKEVFSIKNILARILIQGQVFLMAVIVIVPVIYIFGTAFSRTETGIPTTIWPEKPSWEAFRMLTAKGSMFRVWYKNTIIIALINMLVGTVIITGASYVFARFNFKGKKAGLLSILVLQAFPSFMGLLAMYVLFWKFGLLGKPTALTILYIGGSIPGNLWLIKGFLDQIPKDLDESAMIDGASKLKIFTKIILPLSIPILTFVAVSMFMGPWMDFMLPSYLLNHPPSNAPANYDVQQQWTLAVGIYDFIDGSLDGRNYPAFAAASLIVGMPIAVLYMAFQKYLIEGIMAGATKG